MISLTKLSTAAQQFMDQRPTELGRVGTQVFYKHPTRGDTAPIYTIGDYGQLINTQFHDLGDLENLMDEVHDMNEHYEREGMAAKRQEKRSA